MSGPSREHMLRQMREMEAILPQVEAELLGYPNVETVTVGAKERREVATPQLAFQVYVTVKKPPSELAQEDRIPDTILGFPTDVILIQEASPTAGEDTYRPVLGGTQLQQSAGEGTLGIIAIATAGSAAPEDDPVILTNSHVAPTNGKLVGQPKSPCDCWCCACCDIGRVVDTQIGPAGAVTVDGAIATLNEGMRYSHEIVEVGAVRGSVSATTLVPGTDRVKKRGRTTELTHGILSSAGVGTRRGDGVTFVNQIRVTSLPGGPPFQLGGDSGAVLLDSQDRVIGLMHAAVLPAGTPAFASRIEDVMALLNVRIPVMGTPGAVPLSMAAAPSAAAERHAALAALGQRLHAIDAAGAWWELVERHRDEVRDLVQAHRGVSLAWQRYQGPAFLSHYMKTATEAEYLVPEEIGGIAPENLLVGMAAVLEQHGSPVLAADIREHYLDALQLSRGCRRIDHALDRLERERRAGPAARSHEEPAPPGPPGGVRRTSHREPARA